MYLPFLLPDLMAHTRRHPRLTRMLLSWLSRAPLASRLMPVLARASLGATAFELHDVDVIKGRIGIGGVDEVIFSSKFVGLFHRVLARHVGEEEKNKILYEIGFEGGYWEVSEALAHHRWMPRKMARIIEEGKTEATLAADPDFARLFSEVLSLALRLIINEGGWGVATVDLLSKPMRATLRNSQESRWEGPSNRPVCHLSAGVMAGYASKMMGRRLDSREVACAAAGAPECVFEVGPA